MARNILKSSVEKATFSIVFQLMCRCITFILNAFIIRLVGQDILGIMNVRLLLLESTILFLSREPLLKACLSDAKSHNWNQVFNQIWLSVPISCLLGSVLSYVWINLLSATDESYAAQYKLACYAIAISCVIDQMTQCVTIIAQSYCFVKLKIILDTIYIFVRTITFVILVIKYPKDTINIFALAQLSSSIIYCVLFYTFFSWYIKTINERRQEKKKESKPLTRWDSLFTDMTDFNFKSIKDFLPGKREDKEPYLNYDLLKLTISFAKQSITKQILTEGERYVMTISPVLTFTEQSMYDIVNNLGSLAARFLFRPIEESAYFYFTQMIKREIPIIDQDKNKVKECCYVLTQLCKVVSSIGLVVLVFGQTYSHTLLHLYGGNVLTDTDLPTTLLRYHCFAVLLLALNGVTECYVFATMDTSQLNRYNYIMVIFSVMFLLLSYILTTLVGPFGFIIANCLNMLARIIHSVYFINNQYKKMDFNLLNEIKPDVFFMVMLCLSGLFTQLSKIYVYPTSLFLHVVIGGIFFILTVGTWAIENIKLIKFGMEKYGRRKSLKNE